MGTIRISNIANIVRSVAILAEGKCLLKQIVAFTKVLA